MLYIMSLVEVLHKVRLSFNMKWFYFIANEVLFDRPWQILMHVQVNHSPSFSVDTPLDLKVKESLITDTLKLVRMDPSGYSKLRTQVISVQKIMVATNSYVCA